MQTMLLLTLGLGLEALRLSRDGRVGIDRFWLCRRAFPEDVSRLILPLAQAP